MLYLLLLFTFFCSQELHALTLKQKASAIEWQDEKNDFFRPAKFLFFCLEKNLGIASM